MREPFLRSFSSLSSSTDSWFERVRENFQQLLTPSNFRASSANGAPIHLLRFEKSARPKQAQSASLVTHAVIAGTLVILSIHPAVDIPPGPLNKAFQFTPLQASPSLLATLRELHPSEGKSGGGGAKVHIPATQGRIVAMSSMQIVKPSLPQNREVILPVPPTILDPDAPAVLPRIDDPGLPWMKDRNNSPGPGSGNTIGNGGKDGMGDRDGDGAGFDKGTYQPGMTSPKCVYCPDPMYSDEARESKVQGSVMLEVLVDANGHASQIRIVKGIGMGLDERAVQSVRTWRFQPARDAAHRAVPAWITIEAIFRLF